MLSGLAASAVLTALVAGVTGAWSPCGFSMVDTIGTALGDTRRFTTALACATFALGAVVGGAVTFGGLAWLGQAVGGSDGVSETLGVVLALAAALADWRGLKIAPQIRRQVPERWRWSMPLALASALYGVLLGLGFTTFVLAFAVWALAGVSFAAASPLVGVLIGAAFGVGRALPIVWMAPGWSSQGALRLERMTCEPRLWLGLRRLDALGLCLCALFLTGTVAQAATVTAASDPSAAGGELAWQSSSGVGVVRLASGVTSTLPGGFPALGGASIVWAEGGVITVADMTTMAVKATIPAPPVSALAVSDGWVVYRGASQRSGEKLVGVALPPSTQAPRLLASAPTGEIGRPSLAGSTVVFSFDTPNHATIDAVNLAGGARRRLRTSTYGATLTNPSLLNGRLLYERTDRCAQQLRLGSPSTTRGERVLLSLPSTVPRDTGYEPGHQHAYNTGSLCHNRGTAPGSVQLGTTALTASTAYVTEIPGNPAQARILAVPR